MIVMTTHQIVEEAKAKVKVMAKEMIAMMTGKMSVIKVKMGLMTRKLRKKRRTRSNNLINLVLLTCLLSNSQANTQRSKSFSFANFASTQLSYLKSAKSAAKFTALAALMIGK